MSVFTSPNRYFWRQLARYMVTTGLVIAVDVGSYWLLSPLLVAMAAKGISYCLAGVVGFLLNKFWTFRAEELATCAMSTQTQPRGQIPRFLVLNGVSLLGNILSNQTVLNASTPGLGYNRAKWLGLAAAVVFSTVFNYLGQKYWVFR